MRRRLGDTFESAILVARSPIAGYPIVVAADAITSWVVGDLRAATNIYDASILYLLVILGGASIYGLGPAVVAALVAFGLFDWFLDPVGTLIPDGPAEWLSLTLFLIVGIVTSELAAGQRRRADEAVERERETTSLFLLNTLLVSTHEPSDFISDVLRVFKDDLDLEGLALLVPDPMGKLAQWAAAGRLEKETEADQQRAIEVFRDGRLVPSGPRLTAEDLSQSLTDQPASQDPRRTKPDETMYVSVRARGRPIAVLCIDRRKDAPSLTDRQHRFVAAIAQLSGIALDRASFQREAAEGAARRRAEEVKTALLNSVTHDLRTPIAVIKVTAANLRRGHLEWTDDEKEGFASSIEKNADRLDGLVGNLLELSRIDAGMVQPTRQYYPLSALVDDVVGRLAGLLANNNLSIDVSDDLPPVAVDYVAIDRVLSNLLENAVIHTPHGTAVSVAASRSGSELIVSVADAGPGISPAVVPHLFERFYRGTAPRPDARRGTGLGLAVVKGLVEAHNGRVWVESHESGGTTFFFSLPIDAKPPDSLLASAQPVTEALVGP